MSGYLIRRGRVIDPANGLDGVRDVLVRDGKIEAVSERPLDLEGVSGIDAMGHWVVPGFIDLHTHLREPGEEGKETILTGSRAGVAGGFTTLVAMPNTKPANDSPLVTRLMIERAAAANLCRVLPAGAITKGLKGEELAELGELKAAGCVVVTDDGRPVMNAGLMRRALLYAKTIGLVVMVHEEDLNLSGRGAMTEGPRATRLGLLPIPPSAEVSMVARDLVLVEETGTRLHFAHLSCAQSVRRVREAKRRGLPVTAEACPHHFTLTDEAVEGYDTHAKMNPPLRHAADVEAVREGLADGTIDAIATDHAPHTSLDKEVPFDCAANGVIGLETALPLTLALVRAGRLSEKRAVELLTSGPAKAFGLPYGQLAPGAVGDLTIVDPEHEWTLQSNKLFSKSRNTPFAGWRLKGKVTHTFVRGRLVFEGGAITEGLQA